MAEERDEAVEAVVEAVHPRECCADCMEPADIEEGDCSSRDDIRRAAAAAREPLLKRIEDLELAVAAARSRAEAAEKVRTVVLDKLVADAKAEGRRQALEEAAWEMDDMAGVYLLPAEARVLSGAIRALAKEGR